MPDDLLTVGQPRDYRRSLRDGASGHVASTTSVPDGAAQFCDVPPAGFEPALSPPEGDASRGRRMLLTSAGAGYGASGRCWFGLYSARGRRCLQNRRVVEASRRAGFGHPVVSADRRRVGRGRRLTDADLFSQHVRRRAGLGCLRSPWDVRTCSARVKRRGTRRLPELSSERPAAQARSDAERRRPVRTTRRYVLHRH